MSTEVHLHDVTEAHARLVLPDESGAAWDPVLVTAGDRPSHDSLPALADPAADREDVALAARRADVEEKHRRVVAFLDAHGYDAVVLGRADSIAWFTSGGDLGRDYVAEAAAVRLFVNRRCRCVIADNVQSPRAFEEELAGLGFQLKERAWHEGPERVAAELGRGLRVAADDGLNGWPDERGRLAAIRLPLTKLERQRLRELGRTLALALEATCRNFQPGETEADLAGHLAHRLLREGVTPLDLRVAGDDRLDRYRRPMFKAAAIGQRAVIGAVGRRHGLCAAATRVVSFGPPPPDVRQAHALAAMVAATLIYFSRPGEPVAEVFRRARRIYEKFGRPHEWTLDYQGTLLDYARGAPLRPDSPLVLGPDMPVCWGPSVGPVRCEDTVVVDARGFEVVTEAQRWPKLEIMVKGFPLPRPGILER